MSSLKLPFPLSPPNRADGTLLPACCAACLAALGALQLGLTGAVEVPAAGWAGGGVRAGLTPIALAAADPVLRETTIFSPARTAGAAGDAAGSPLGGTAIAGSVAVRGRSYAVVQRPDGSVARVGLGGIVAGYRLVALEPDAAILSNAGKRIRVAYGAAPVLQSPDAPAEDIEEQSE